MLGFNGGLIGATRTTSIRASNPGVWLLREQAAAISRGQWPGDTRPGSLVLLGEGDNGSTDFIDNSTNNFTPTIFGNTQISTAEKKYGLSSIYFDGSGDYLAYASNAAFAFATGDYTIQFWIYRLAQTSMNIIDMRNGGTSAVAPVVWFNGANLNYYTAGAGRIAGGSVVSNQWHHIALCRSGTSTRLFLNGTQTGSTYTDSNNYITTGVRIGASHDAGSATNFVNGYIDDLQIIKEGLYTSSFTPPEAL